MRMKTKYIIDYGDGNQVAIMAGSIGEAMKIADTKIRYTERPMVILDSKGAEICRRKWYGKDSIKNIDANYKGYYTTVSYGSSHSSRYGVYTDWEEVIK